MDADFFAESGADFSPCGYYRYRLWRRWEEGPTVAFIMLNPSTADADRNDPTIERCHRRAVDMGFGGLEVVNLFGYRATSPKDLKAAARPIGPENDDAMLSAARAADMVICAWGSHGAHQNRHAEVVALLQAHDVTPHVLSLTKGGLPGHPLYLSYSRQPFVWRGFTSPPSCE
ncbi:MAG: DUF1643 domain-containing protein [Alphaproteobacteria bacterium]|nr:MAG: DUF1643 domain-containing protein [Alphaproteobacteria bacterium]